ncbi:MarR family winged helix-turn-helix transcriptional regulator [Idiomarina xiamenensis]|uniref:Putative transcriptional regulator OhrR n=1 Tax=Idiomarina xiamenensis 10-D-4 TaxID=740709 RepID=K2KYT2_9GAMM|nr:MarR family transcriptional regulator [Idiomarina xiamenensis]EKE87679.1 putative transcriptional regulator OhrR [Idiomarina xiamenensis 10-D-4]
MTDLLKLDNQLCHRFYTISNALTRAYRPLLQALDLTYPQYLTLLALWERDQVSIHNLLRKTRIDGGAMSLMLKKLSAKGLLEIHRADNDQRSRVVVLTAAGRALKNKAESVPEAMLCHLSALSATELQQLRGLLDKLATTLNHD